MPALVAGIHILRMFSQKDVDGRVEPGHDEFGDCQITLNSNF
jgi:hypothetical protein